MLQIGGRTIGAVRFDGFRTNGWPSELFTIHGYAIYVLYSQIIGIHVGNNLTILSNLISPLFMRKLNDSFAVIVFKELFNQQEGL